MGEPDLESLARVAAEVAAELGVELGPPFELSRFSYVAPAGEDAVLKVVPPDDDEAEHEPDALAFWGGDGAVRLLHRDDARRAILLERARPGTDLGALRDDEEATAIAIDVGRRLWRSAGEPFRWIGDHVSRWLDDAERRGERGELLPLARELYSGLVPGRATLVHGDFHHHNLLDAGSRWVAIDTKAMLGEREFDVPSFLWNPLFQPMRLDVTERRIAMFAAAGLDEDRIRTWTVIRGAYLRPSPEFARVIRQLAV